MPSPRPRARGEWREPLDDVVAVGEEEVVADVGGIAADGGEKEDSGAFEIEPGGCAKAGVAMVGDAGSSVGGLLGVIGTGS